MAKGVTIARGAGLVLTRDGFVEQQCFYAVSAGKRRGPFVTEQAARAQCEHVGFVGVSNPDVCGDCAEHYAQAESEHWAKHG